MEFVPLAGCDRRWSSEYAGEDASGVSHACHNQVLIKGSLQNASVGNPQNRVRWFDVVGDTEARFYLAIARKSSVQVTANAHIEGPTTLGNRVLDIQRNFFDVGVAAKRK